MSQNAKDALTQPSLRVQMELEILNDPERYAAMAAVEQALSQAVHVAAEEMNAVLANGSQDRGRVVVANLMARDFIAHVVSRALGG